MRKQNSQPAARSDRGKPIKIRRPRKGSKTEAILTLTATTPATPPEIAESVNTSRQMVHQVLQRYSIDSNTTESFKKHRAEVIAGYQERILAGIDPNALKSSTPRELKDSLTAFGILYDKERLERGLSTSNTAISCVLDAADGGEDAIDITPSTSAEVVDNSQKTDK